MEENLDDLSLRLSSICPYKVKNVLIGLNTQELIILR